MQNYGKHCWRESNMSWRCPRICCYCRWDRRPDYNAKDRHSCKNPLTGADDKRQKLIFEEHCGCHKPQQSKLVVWKCSVDGISLQPVSSYSQSHAQMQPTNLKGVPKVVTPIRSDECHFHLHDMITLRGQDAEIPFCLEFHITTITPKCF